MYRYRANPLRLSMLLASAALAACGSSDKETPPPAPTLTLLSAKPELVTGGKVLVDLAIPTGASAAALEISVNGASVAAAFAPDSDHPGHLVGLVTGLKEGANTLAASFGGQAASTTITNYGTAPLSGPALTPFNCQTESFVLPDGSKLGAALDADCRIATRVHYLYLPQGAAALKPLPSTSALPPDTASTTTTAGVTLPFVVRVETGSMNRGI